MESFYDFPIGADISYKIIIIFTVERGGFEPGHGISVTDTSIFPVLIFISNHRSNPVNLTDNLGKARNTGHARLGFFHR
ncbi:hypothetical protein D3C80_1354760 [compost metagenome]